MPVQRQHSETRRPPFGIRARIVDGAFAMEIAQAGGRVFLDHVRIISMRTADGIDLVLPIETVVIDDHAILRRTRLVFSFCVLRPAEHSRVYRDVHLHVSDREAVPSVELGEGERVGELDSVHVAVIVVIDLRGDAADGRLPVTDQPAQQVSVLVEKERCEHAPRTGTLDNI
jgi:hypothetical protein